MAAPLSTQQHWHCRVLRPAVEGERGGRGFCGVGVGVCAGCVFVWLSVVIMPTFFLGLM